MDGKTELKHMRFFAETTQMVNMEFCSINSYQPYLKGCHHLTHSVPFTVAFLPKNRRESPDQGCNT